MKKQKRYFKNQILQETISKAGLIIFDVNGLIVDDESIQLEAVNLALINTGFGSIDKSFWIQNCVGHRADSYLKDIIFIDMKQSNNSNNFVIDPIVSKLIKMKNKYYAELLKDRVFDLVRPGFLDFIKYLSDEKKLSNLKLAIATSAVEDEAEAILGGKGLNIKKYFDYIVTGSEIIKSKPDPEIYYRIVQTAKINPKDGLVFEDSELGVEAAFRAGLNIIAVPNEFTKNQNFEKAKLIITDFTEKAELIK